MEFKDFLAILKKNIVFVLILGVLGLVLAQLLTRQIQKNYQQTKTFFVTSKLPHSNQSQDLASFYGQEKARNFTDTAIAILESIDFKNSLQETGSITVKKEAPQVITITASASQKQEAEQLLGKTVQTFNQKLTTLNSEDTSLEEIGKAQEAQKPQPNKKVYLLAGLILGAAAGILAVSLKTYFRL